MSVALDKIKPSDCVLAFGIPTCEEEFGNAKSDALGRDFVIKQVWHEYDFHFVSHLKKIEPKMRKLGARIIYDLTLEKFGELFRDASNKVVILFSHWTDETVEFFDGMKTEKEIINVVPKDFDGIIDLCACHPKSLALKLRNHLPEFSLVKRTDVENTPRIWLYFYWAVFTALNDSNNSGDKNSGITYLEALEKTVNEFKKKN